MDTFGKIRSGISELRKEKEALKTRYEFLADELARLVTSNGKEIKAVAVKAAQVAEGLAAASENIDRLGKSITEVERRFSDGISSLGKNSEDQKKALIELSERMQRVQSSADGAMKDAKAGEQRDRALTKYFDEIRDRVSGLEVLRERIGEIEKAGSLLVKGVRNLEDMRSEIAGMDERIAALAKGLDEKTSLLDTKILTSVAPVKKESDAQSAAIKRIDSGIVRVNMDLQSIRKDIAAERASIAGVRASSAENRKRLEMLGTLKSQVENIEQIKTGLVKGVESLKGMTSKFSALEQKTRDLDARLTNADKAIDAKIDDKAKALDRQISGKTKAMESQMQERLASLQTNLTEKGKTMETRLVDLSKQLEGGLSSDLAGMRKDIGMQIAAGKKAQLEMEKAKAMIGDLKSSFASSSTGIAEAGKQLASLTGRVDSLESLKEKVKVIEDAKDSLLAGMGDLAGVKEELAVLEEKNRTVEASVRRGRVDTESRLRKNAGTASELGKGMISLGKQIDDAKKAIGGLSAAQTDTEKRLTSLEKLRQKTRDIELLGKTLTEKLKEINPIKSEIAALKSGLESGKRDVEQIDSVLHGKLDYNTNSLKKESAFNAASLAKLDEEVKKLSLGLRSIDKEWTLGRKEVTETRIDLKRLEKKMGDIEKIQARLKEIEQAREDMSTAMDTRLEDKMQFMEMSLRQRGENIEADLAESMKVLDTRLSVDITGLKKDLAGKGRSLDRAIKRLDALSRVEERLGFIDEQKEEIAKSVASLESMKAGQAQMGERGRNLEKEVREMKASISREIAGLRGLIDSAKTGDRSKFDSAVKAFLTTRGDLKSKMSGLGVQLTELESRMNDFSRSLLRLDLLEKKMERMSDQGTALRRDMDKLETKEDSGEKVVLVDLDGEKGAI